ncbi:McrC family protein [Spirillospora sp. NPDC048911]|uniref:McrC family protein n=1 Tax=Spirillospora sp. NPDC048911 TaxID=3364527 RepID=UPI00371C7960
MIELIEGVAQEVALTAEQATELADSKVVQLGLSPVPGRFVLRDRGIVGAARIAGLQLRIKPKTPVHRLFFLLGYAQGSLRWQQAEVDAGQHTDLLAAIAHAFARAAERALSRGVLQGYREVEEALPYVRGRVLVGEQLRSRYGMPLPVEVRYDEYDVDITENRLLLAATYRLLRLPGIPLGTRTLLRHLPIRLAGVSPLLPGRPLPEWRPTRLNARYHAALGLAELVLRGDSLEFDGETIRVDGLLVDMWRVFESFVGAALAEALRPYGGRVVEQDTAHHLDHGSLVPLRPDFLYYRATALGIDKAAAVADAKYKIERRPGAHGQDLYQMLAYCTALGLPAGHLVYAAGAAERHTHEVVGSSGIRIVQYTLDLAQPSDILLGQVAEIAELMADSTTPGRTA